MIKAVIFDMDGVLIDSVQAGLAAGCRVIGFTQYNAPKKPLPGVVMTVKKWGDISYNKLLRLG